ncbi:hypothetical protein HS088_TW03G00998 [Tripterygium wilfordii]|uniref:Uncharacterized protein n=1 Tax=Tripterygium wilfordii TaxID=458696 RepID=A0A7J7DWJ2_TRIWF|nr:hypothetical protein HS088_TW03G00998 [Tripterygium wilfordii]
MNVEEQREKPSVQSVSKSFASSVRLNGMLDSDAKRVETGMMFCLVSSWKRRNGEDVLIVVTVLSGFMVVLLSNADAKPNFAIIAGKSSQHCTTDVGAVLSSKFIRVVETISYSLLPLLSSFCLCS